jgi:hypothetical protein
MSDFYSKEATLVSLKIHVKEMNEDALFMIESGDGVRNGDVLTTLIFAVVHKFKDFDMTQREKEEILINAFRDISAAVGGPSVNECFGGAGEVIEG